MYTLFYPNLFHATFFHDLFFGILNPQNNRCFYCDMNRHKPVRRIVYYKNAFAVKKGGWCCGFFNKFISYLI